MTKPDVRLVLEQLPPRTGSDEGWIHVVDVASHTHLSFNRVIELGIQLRRVELAEFGSNMTLIRERRDDL